MTTAFEIYEESTKEFMQGIALIETEASSLKEIYLSQITVDPAYVLLDPNVGVCQSTRLAKEDVEDANAMVENVANFFIGESNVNTKYLDTINKLRFADSNVPAVFSRPLEEYGELVVTFVTKIKDFYESSVSSSRLYRESQISRAVVNVNLDYLPFTDVPKELILRSNSFYTNWISMLEGEAVNPADYSGIISRWRAFI